MGGGCEDSSSGKLRQRKEESLRGSFVACFWSCNLEEPAQRRATVCRETVCFQHTSRAAARKLVVWRPTGTFRRQSISLNATRTRRLSSPKRLDNLAPVDFSAGRLSLGCTLFQLYGNKASSHCFCFCFSHCCCCSRRYRYSCSYCRSCSCFCFCCGAGVSLRAPGTAMGQAETVAERIWATRITGEHALLQLEKQKSSRIVPLGTTLSAIQSSSKATFLAAFSFRSSASLPFHRGLPSGSPIPIVALPLCVCVCVSPNHFGSGQIETTTWGRAPSQQQRFLSLSLSLSLAGRQLGHLTRPHTNRRASEQEKKLIARPAGSTSGRASSSISNRPETVTDRRRGVHFCQCHF